MDFDSQIELIIFWVDFDYFRISAVFEAGGGVVKIGSSLKPKHHNQI